MYRPYDIGKSISPVFKNALIVPCSAVKNCLEVQKSATRNSIIVDLKKNHDLFLLRAGFPNCKFKSHSVALYNHE